MHLHILHINATSTHLALTERTHQPSTGLHIHPQYRVFNRTKMLSLTNNNTVSPRGRGGDVGGVLIYMIDNIIFVYCEISISQNKNLLRIISIFYFYLAQFTNLSDYYIYLKMIPTATYLTNQSEETKRRVLLTDK